MYKVILLAIAFNGLYLKESIMRRLYSRKVRLVTGFTILVLGAFALLDKFVGVL
jgi:hypothetical protein